MEKLTGGTARFRTLCRIGFRPGAVGGIAGHRVTQVRQGRSNLVQEARARLDLDQTAVRTRPSHASEYFEGPEPQTNPARTRPARELG